MAMQNRVEVHATDAGGLPVAPTNGAGALQVVPLNTLDTLWPPTLPVAMQKPAETQETRDSQGDSSQRKETPSKTPVSPGVSYPS